jgi:hypothetical protein
MAFLVCEAQPRLWAESATEARHGREDIQQHRRTCRQGLARAFSTVRATSSMTSKGANVYRLTGELVGHFSADRHGSEKHLDKSADKLFR